MPYDYDSEILAQLTTHGLSPRPTTPPDFVRDYVSDLYRYEIRKLRRRLLAKQFPREEYSGRVIALRKRYWVLAVPTHLWVRSM